MKIVKQLALFLENRPGTLARVCDALSKEHINILAASTSDTVDHTVIRMVVSDYQKALYVFEEHGTLAIEDDVLMVEADNKPGSFGRIAHAFAKAKINIEYFYFASDAATARGFMIIRTSSPKKGLQALKKALKVK